jgi:hypothetical protein
MPKSFPLSLCADTLQLGTVEVLRDTLVMPNSGRATIHPSIEAELRRASFG